MLMNIVALKEIKYFYVRSISGSGKKIRILNGKKYTRFYAH